MMHPLSSKFLYYFLILFFFIACHKQEEMTANSPNLSEIPDQEGWRSTLTTTNNGKIRAKIKYEHMEKYSKKNIIKFNQGVEIDFYDPNGYHTSKVYSQKAVLNENSKNVELIGNVVVLSDSGLILRTEKLLWNETEGKILSNEYVTVITAENDSIYGIGFESGQALKNWIIKKPRGVTQKKLNLEVLETPSKRKTNEKN